MSPVEVKKVFNWLVNFLLLLVFLALALISLGSWLEKNNPRHVPGLGRYKLISVLSDSMKPVMLAGDAIVVDSGAVENIKEGDIITYWRSNNAHSLLTHRIIHVENRGGQNLFYTRGDANKVMDGNPVPTRDIVGKYLFCIPRGGYLIGFIHNRAGFLLLIMLPILLAVLLEIKRVYPHLAVYYCKENNKPEANL